MGRLSEALNGYRGSRPTYLNNATRAKGGGAGIAVTAEIDQDAVNQINEALARLMITHPDTKKRIKAMLTKEAKKVRQNISKDLKNNIENDPRAAYQAVKRMLYKKILGFNVSILNPKKGSVKSMRLYHKPRKLDTNPHQRGGNRVPRGSRTNTVMHYGPHDRGWILRIVNGGTTERTAGTHGGRLSGHRGAIAPRNFFAPAANSSLMHAADNLANLIDTELMAMLNKTKK